MGIEGILNGPDFPGAKCKGSGDIFFPETKSTRDLHEQLSDLKFICDTCIYSQGDNPCLQYGMSIPDNMGFWGGKLLGANEPKPTITKTRLNSVAKYTRYGLTQQAIATKMNLDLTQVKQALRLAKEKGLL